MLNQRPFIIILILLLINCILAICDYPTNPILLILRTILYLVAIGIAIFSVQGWKVKMVALIVVLGFTHVRQRMGLWKWKANLSRQNRISTDNPDPRRSEYVILEVFTK